MVAEEKTAEPQSNKWGMFSSGTHVVFNESLIQGLIALFFKNSFWINMSAFSVQMHICPDPQLVPSNIIPNQIFPGTFTENNCLTASVTSSPAATAFWRKYC